MEDRLRERFTGWEKKVRKQPENSKAMAELISALKGAYNNVLIGERRAPLVRWAVSKLLIK